MSDIDEAQELVTIEVLENEFDLYGLEFGSNNDIQAKCLSLCKTYKYDATQLAVALLQLHQSKGYDEITIEGLNQLESEELSKNRKKAIANEQNEVNGNTSSLQYPDDEDDFLNQYDDNPTASKKKDVVRPETQGSRTPVAKKRLELVAPDSPLAPSLSQSPSSQRYSQRANAGAPIASYGNPNAYWQAEQQYVPQISRTTCDKTLAPMNGPYNFMFDKLRDCAQYLDDSIYNLGEQLKESNKIEDVGNVKAVNNAPDWFVGKICCDSVGRLNAASVMLEGDRENCFGASVQLDISRLPKYALFPGQVVAVKGTNPTGERLLAEELVIGSSLPVEKTNITIKREGVQIKIACGPFTTSENLLYEPLSDFLDLVVKEPPHVLILLGPILDSSHPALADPLLTDEYDSIVERCMNKIRSTLQNLNIQIYLVASSKDISCVPIYPTPAYLLGDKDQKEIQLLPDPSILDIDGVLVAITTNDILMHISKEEISFPSQSGDRFARLSHHLLLQQSFYPLYPSPEDFPLHLEHNDLYGRIPVKPNIMILPSDFRGFIKDVDGCVIVNPEKLSKGKVGGSFCKLKVEPSSGGIPKISAIVSRI